MKRAIIFHGTDCKPEDFWYQWLKTELEKEGYQVDLPYYKDMNRVPIAEFLPGVMKRFPLTEETLLVGHSAGAPLILAMLEKTDQRIHKAVLVAGFSEPLSGDRDVILQDSYDWKKIKQGAKNFVFFNSDNDPWGCDDKQGKRMHDNLGGKLLIRRDGHFGSTSMNQPYQEFPELLKECLYEPKSATKTF